MLRETRPISLLPDAAPVRIRPRESRELYRKLAESERAVREWRKRYDDLIASNEMTTPLEFLPPDGVRLIRVVVRRIAEPDILPLLPESDDIT
jgi:hypothetical protein